MRQAAERHLRKCLAYWRVRGVTPRWQLLLVYVLVALVAGLVLHNTHHIATTARTAARAAGLKATLQAEAVCSKSNQGEACRELFDRLARSLSRRQRFRLACDSLAALKTPEADSLHARARCPAPLPSP